MKLLTKNKWCKQTDACTNKNQSHFPIHWTKTGEEISHIISNILLNVILTCLILSIFIFVDYIGLSLTPFEYQLLITAEAFLLINFAIIVFSNAFKGIKKLIGRQSKSNNKGSNNRITKTLKFGISFGWFIVQAIAMLTFIVLGIISMYNFWW